MKKIGLLTVLIMATLLFALAFTAAAAGPKAAATPAVTAPAPAPAVATPAPPHPRVEHAIEALRSARDHMAHAEGEFHGHRDKTIEHIDAAIHEAEICMQEP
jgi:hypothetical protein